MTSYTHLDERQRFGIYLMLKDGYTQTAIADELDVCKSTISREIKRNTGGCGYRWRQAHGFALARRRGKAQARLTDLDWALVAARLREQWSPEQVSLRLAAEGVCRVSHEWIYRFIARDRRAGGDLHTHLRIQKRGKKAYGSRSRRGKIQDAVPIDRRPAVVDARLRLGDWEVDTIIGRAHKGALVSLTERVSRLTLVGKVSRKTAAQVTAMVVRLLQDVGRPALTITADNGLEFAGHKDITAATGAEFYFAHPYASWQRGSNENANGLIRQYAPKGGDFASLTEADMKRIMHRLNNRPRKCLRMKTPNEVFYGKHANTHGVALGN